LPLWAKALVAGVLPFLTIGAGFWIMKSFPAHEMVTQQIERSTIADKAPLNARFGGYDDDDARIYWNELRTADHRNPKSPLNAERVMLLVDLAFPFFYGGALVLGLLMLWSCYDRPMSVAWVLLPVLAVVLADWTENIVQLWQLSRFAGGQDPLPGWIRLASAATLLKLYVIAALSAVSVAGAVGLLVRR